MEIRLQKYLAEAGIASRRTSEKIIEDGRIKVNGQIVKVQGVKVNPEKDIIELDNTIIKLNTDLIYYMLHKPVRIVTTVSDEKGRTTVIDLLNVKERVFPVGRLDYMSSGLLLLTNDGDLTYKLTHPKHKIDKKYIATIKPKVNEESIKKLTKGVDLGIYHTSPCKIKLVKEDKDTQTYEVTLYEGKNRQVRRMFEWAGSNVIKLKRISIGKLTLGSLKSGDFRLLTKEEIKYLKNI